MNFPSYSVLLQSVKNAIRENAEKIPRFNETKQGNIRLLVCPFSPESHEWLGVSGEFNPDDIPDIEDSFGILPGGSRLSIFEEDGGTVKVDTYSMTAMKIAQLSYVQELLEPIEDDYSGLMASLQNLGLLSMSKEDFVTMYERMEKVLAVLQEIEKIESENGFALWRGANCCKVYLEGKPFVYFYASVSGADQDEDQACAIGAIEVVKTFFSDSHFTVIVPTIPKANA